MTTPAIFETIKARQLEARKAKDTVAAALLTTVLGEFQRVVPVVIPTEKQVFSTLEKLRGSVADTVAKVGATDKTTAELQLLDELIALKPAIAFASADEVAAHAAAVIAENPAANMGVVMKALKEKFGTQLDGAQANQIVKSILTR